MATLKTGVQCVLCDNMHFARSSANMPNGGFHISSPLFTNEEATSEMRSCESSNTGAEIKNDDYGIPTLCQDSIGQGSTEQPSAGVNTTVDTLAIELDDNPNSIASTSSLFPLTVLEVDRHIARLQHSLKLLKTYKRTLVKHKVQF